MDSTTATFDSRSERQLRFVTIAAMVPALALLIASGVITYQVLPAIGLVPMAMSAVTGAAILFADISDKRKATADIVMVLSLLAVLIPRYVLTFHLEIYLTDMSGLAGIDQFTTLAMMGMPPSLLPTP